MDAVPSPEELAELGEFSFSREVDGREDLGGLVLIITGGIPGVPDQGLLTVLLGLLLVDFPGKERLQRRLLKPARSAEA